MEFGVKAIPGNNTIQITAKQVLAAPEQEAGGKKRGGRIVPGCS